MQRLYVLSSLIVISLLPAYAAVADTAAPPQTADTELAPYEAGSVEARNERLDELFSQLKRERNEKAAQRIAGQIWDAWLRSGSASVDLMMGWAQKAIDQKKYDVALDFLDEVVTLRPAYAEGWNRRATLHFLMANYAKSMSDIDHTLALEPRHFGALSGMAQILKNVGKKEAAVQIYQRVLDIYPMMRDAQNEVATISEELAGESI